MIARRALMLLLAATSAWPAGAQLLRRPAPASGQIVSTKGGEQAQLVPDGRLRSAAARQELKTGDTLRTNATGTLAVVFADQTQVRLGRNTVLVVRAVANGSPSALQLKSGSLWGRAPRGRSQLSVETPSATAAVRGTDWALTVGEGETELQVFEGAIEFFNPQGRLAVTGGQAARARFGEAPTRIITVSSTEREQMQYYLEIDGLFEFLSPGTSPVRPVPGARRRVLAIPAATRTAADWLALAEDGVSMQPRAEQADALAALGRLALTPAEAARADLLRAWAAAQNRDYARARDLFDRALPGLDAERATIARFGRYVAAIRADPAQAGRLQPPAPEPERLASWLGQAFVAAYVGDYAGARRAGEEAAQRFPESAAGPLTVAEIAILTDDKALVAGAVAEATRRAPDDPEVLWMRGRYEAMFLHRYEAARRSLARARAAAPMNPGMLNDFADLQGERMATRATARIYREAIAESPKDPLLRINHAITLMDENRLAASKREIDAALALDPDFSSVRVARARYLLQMGKAEAALPDALAGSAADPSGADALLVLAILYQRNGDYDVALQQIDAADRLDPAGPTAPLIRAAVALDRMDVDTAITAAREAQRRSVARGGDFANLAQSSSTGGFIASSFREIALDDWGRFYGDRLFEPFEATGYFDRIAAGTADPFLIEQSAEANDPFHAGVGDLVSNLMQGLALEPLAVASAERYLQLFSEQFVEASLGAGVFAQGDDLRATGQVGFQGVNLVPFPIAAYLSADQARRRGPLGAQNDQRDRTATGFLTAEITPYDKLALFGLAVDRRYDLPGERTLPRDNGAIDSNAKQLYAVYAHEFGRKSLLTLAAGFSRSASATRYGEVIPIDPEEGSSPLIVAINIADRIRQHSWLASYAVDLGIVDVNVGAAFPSSKVRRRDRSFIQFDDALSPIGEFTTLSESAERYHLDVRLTPGANLVVQGQIASSDALEGRVIDWRLGAAGQLAPGHWLRAAWFRDTVFPGDFTLAPTRVVGLIPNSVPVPEGARSKTLAIRYDGEWSEQLFTAVEFQRQRVGALSFSLPQLVAPLALNLETDDFGPASLSYGRARIDRLAISANRWIKGGLGLVASYARTWSRLPGIADPDIASPAVADGRVPFLPRHSGRIGLSWASPARLRASASATYTGSRRYLAYAPIAGLAATDRRLGGFVSADLTGSWEADDRRWLVSAAVTNFFDAGYELVPGVPGYGRTATLSATYRF